MEETGGKHISCTMTSVLLGLVRQAGGEASVASVIERSGCDFSAAFLEDGDNWVPHRTAAALLEAGRDVTGDPLLARRVGEQAVRRHAGSQVATLLRSLGSPEAVLRSIALTAGKFSTVSEMEAVEASPGRAVVRLVARPGFERLPIMCDWTTGLLSQPTVLFGLPPARVEETECGARGGSECRYTISWDRELAAAAADPEQRATALEAQVVAMSERLQSAYATAGDLASLDEIDVVLARIVERAANAVRAPSYVLAVRTDADAELQVYSHGLPADEANEVAHSLLGEGRAATRAALTADVSSSRRNYGRLAALYPAGMHFFPQEQQMLELYAKHAAAVLDTAMAFDEAARRHEQVSALLSLSHALARAGTSEEVAERLVAAVPAVIDCDRIGVWLYDDRAAELRSMAVAGLDDEQRAVIDSTPIRTADTPYVGRLIAQRRPLYFEAGSTDPFIGPLLERVGAAAIIVVPIVARDEFLGILNVGVSDRPERLKLRPELLERLTGIAALAAPAIQNGRLVDELGHKASHDGLTGLVNRFGFGQRIESALGVGARQVGLLFIDLNGFKQVNDRHGHDAGDELLRQVAERLSAAVRESDTVARLGGDEFAVILANVRSEADVAAAATHVRNSFSDGFVIGGQAVAVRASVGSALWPDDGRTVESLIRQADGAMYDDKARARAGI